MSKTILFLAANPVNTGRLRLDGEISKIDEGLRRAKQRDVFRLEKRGAVQPNDVGRALLDIEPNIVHFSGHGEGEAGIVLEDATGQSKLVDDEALAGLFELFAGSVECVVLNACYSEAQARAIARHIPWVIGMSAAISDTAALEFAVAFYDALGAGKPFEFAYKYACQSIRMAGIPEHLTPVLEHRVTDKKEPEQPVPIAPKLKHNISDKEKPEQPVPEVSALAPPAPPKTETTAADPLVQPSGPPAPKPSASRRNLLNKRKVTGLLVLGIAVLLLFGARYLPHSPLKALEESALDFAIMLTQNSFPNDEKQFVLIDIDNLTFREQWNNPTLTPRARLAQLIDISAKAQAAITIVDIDLSKPGEDGDALKRYLQGYPNARQCPDKEARPWKRCTQIIFLRFFQKPLSETGGSQTEALLEPVPSFLDEVIAQSPDLHWASNQLVGPDNQVRGWKHWQTACHNQRSVAIPSLIWLSEALMREPPDGGPETKASPHIRTALEHFEGQGCQSLLPAPQLWRYPEESNTPLLLWLPPSELQQRILYKIPSKHDHPLLTTLVVGDDFLLNPDWTIQRWQPAINDKIVVIGGSFDNSGDHWITPVAAEDMPGSLIILNALYSLQQYGQPGPVFWLYRLGLTLIFGTLLVAAMLRLRPAWVISAFILSWMLVFGLSLWFISKGQWLDFSFPGILLFSVLLIYLFKNYKL
ncbi:MAG: CHASE2 domain-containing protein [Gammaproteobacteria bacterium]|nr:CHASE2 domain-containing protein [Gammaproteobacteria bacterium]